MATRAVPLIPRDVLLASPKRWQPTISPDGAKLAYFAPDERETMQIWVRTLGKDDDRCVSEERRSIQPYRVGLSGVQNPGWTWDSATLLYAQDKDGD